MGGICRVIPTEIKQQILERVKSGVPVPQAAKDAGVCSKTVHGWLAKQVSGGTGSLVELGQLKRENQALLSLIVKLTLELEQKKKNSH